MQFGLRYLAERTVALNEYIDKVQWYQDIVRKIIAGLIIAAVVAVFAVIFVKVGKRKNDDDDEDEDEEIEEEPVEEVEELLEIDIEVPEDEDEDEILPEIQLEPEAFLDEEDVEQEEVEEETPDLSIDGFVPDFEDDVTEGGLFYAADTEEMKALFKDFGFNFDDFVLDYHMDVYAQVKAAGDLRILPYLRDRKLTTVAEHLRVNLENAHNALADIKATKEVSKSLHGKGVPLK